MNILSYRYIPLKIYIHRKKPSLKIAWHWSWSITWRWMVDWQFCRTNWAIQGFKNPSNGCGWRNICMGRLGVIRIQVQSNMKRKD